MDVRTCKICKNLFNFQSSPICPACEKKMEEKFAEVKKYIRDNPKASVKAVADDCEVPIPQLKKWVRQERLQFSKDSGITISCEMCGKPIFTGRFCAECKDKMTNSLGNVYREEKKPQEKKKTDGSAKMRFMK